MFPLPTQDEINAWYKDMPEKFKNHIQKMKSDVRSETIKEVEEELDDAQQLKRILIPLIVFAFPAGMLAQRYLVLIS